MCDRCGEVFQIAIDGPVGSGKSTVAKLVAERLGILYIDTGAMYRSVALKCLWEGVEWSDEVGVVGLVEDIDIVLRQPEGDEVDGRNVTVLLDGEDVSWDIRTNEIANGASIVSQYPEVRDVLVRMQQDMAKTRSVIMEGRDIGTRVLPDATLKIYMDADVDVRAMRKVEQMKKIGVEIDFEESKKAIMMRDEREMNRKVDPLRPADGAWMLDTTDLSISEVVDRICKRFM